MVKFWGDRIKELTTSRVDIECSICCPSLEISGESRAIISGETVITPLSAFGPGGIMQVAWSQPAPIESEDDVGTRIPLTTAFADVSYGLAGYVGMDIPEFYTTAGMPYGIRVNEPGAEIYTQNPKTLPLELTYLQLQTTQDPMLDQKLQSSIRKIQERIQMTTG